MNVRILLFLFLFLAGCGTQNRGLPRVGVRGQPRYDTKLYVQVRISERANQNHPIALDLLVVYDDEVLEAVTAMTGKDWFARREQVRRDHRGMLDVWSWEWVPGQVVPLQAVPLSARSGKGFIFADYLGAGDHRYKIDPHQDITIRLLEKEVVVGRLR